MNTVLLAAVALPALAALVCALLGVRLGDGAGRLGAAAAGVAFFLAVGLAVPVVTSGPVSAVITDGDGAAVVGLFADRLSVAMLLLVLGVSAVVQLFASRNMSGDGRQVRLIAAAGLTTTAVAAVATAATLSGLVVAWLVSGVGLVVLLAQRADLASARVGVRRAVVAFAVGDLALVLGASVVWATVGDLDLRRVDVGGAAVAAQRLEVWGMSVSAGAVVACLLVVAAMGRSAQIPLQSWLPATLTAPTPVSAFLHAGLVNAGGFLLVRLGPIFGLSGVATHVAFVAGALTALYGTVLMLTKSDVKGALAHSTMGQMGFMLMACALGAFAAAIFHLVAHGMYKATLFLGADSVVHNDKRRQMVARPAPAGVRWPAGARLAVAAIVPAAALAAALATVAPAALDHSGAIVLVTFAWATAAQAAWAWLDATPGRALMGLTALAASCVVYVALVSAADAFLAPALGELAHPVSPWWALAPAAALLAAMIARLGPASAWRNALYVRVMDAGHVAGSSARGASPRRRKDRVAVLHAPGSVTA